MNSQVKIVLNEFDKRIKDWVKTTMDANVTRTDNNLDQLTASSEQEKENLAAMKTAIDNISAKIKTYSDSVKDLRGITKNQAAMKDIQK